MGSPIVVMHSDAYARFAREMVAMRNRAGITQRELAKRIKQSHSGVNKQEQGKRRVDVVELDAICEACGESLVDFVRRLKAPEVE